MADSAHRLATRARCGEFRAVLPELHALAERDGANAGDRWQAAAAAITIMFWLGEVGQAADLAERVIDGQSSAGQPILSEDFPFDMALLAAQLHGGVPAGPRLDRLAGQLSGESVLGRRLSWLSRELTRQPVERLLPNYSSWGEPPAALDGVAGAEHLDADYSTLPVAKRRALWNALRSTNQFELAWDLMERSKDLPRQWAVCVWFAGWCATVGKAAEGRQLLVSAHDRWQPYAKWDCLPSDVPLQPVLRPLVVEDVREFYLTQPIGPKARKKR